MMTLLEVIPSEDAPVVNGACGIGAFELIQKLNGIVIQNSKFIEVGKKLSECGIEITKI